MARVDEIASQCILLFGGYQNLALFPGLPTIQFLIACSIQKRRGKDWSILSRDGHQCLPIGRQRGGGSPIERRHAFCACVLRFVPGAVYIFYFVNIQNSSAWGRNYKIRSQARSFNGGPLPPSVYL